MTAQTPAGTGRPPSPAPAGFQPIDTTRAAQPTAPTNPERTTSR